MDDRTPPPSPLWNRGIKHLIIVCCHAIWLGGPNHGINEDEWLLEPFQVNESATFYNHIREGISILEQNPESFLVFSGGATKQDKTPLSEGQSYLNLAHLFTSHKSHLQSRMAAETFSTDSYQNLLFSILHFKQRVLTYPVHLTILTHDFKCRRFLELHLPALHWPMDRVTFVGRDPPDDVTPREELEQAEGMMGYGVWKEDLYGVGEVLRGKRERRGWKVEEGGRWLEDAYLGVAIEESDEREEEAIGRLLRWKGGKDGKEVFPGVLPWE